jgi:predicted RND superfamily exporter protein
LLEIEGFAVIPGDVVVTPSLPSPNRFLLAWTQQALRRPGRLLLVATLLTLISAWLASGLEVRSSFEELLPSDVPSVQHVRELVRRVGGDGTVLVNIEALEGANGLADAKRIAAALAQEFLAYGPGTIRSVERNLKRVEAWYADHWPLFLEVDTLRQARDALKKEIARVKAKANPLLLHLDDEESAETTIDPSVSPWLDPKHPMPRDEVKQRFARYEDGFLVHPDGKSLTLVVRPAGTSLGVSEARQLLDRMQKTVNKYRDDLRWHFLRVGFGGTFPIFVAEYESILNDIGSTALWCLSFVLASLFLFFRDLRSTLALGIAVVAAVAVTFGLTRLVIGYLNTQTAFLGAIVVGNGINYGLIYLARVRQLRRVGVPIEAACADGAATSARATLVASAASSISFGVLILAANRGFRHFGFIGGIGMLLCWVFTFALVPALLAVFERIRIVSAGKARPSRRGVPRFLLRFFAYPKLMVSCFAVLAVVSMFLFIRQLPNALERNLDNLTNELRGEDRLIRDNDRAQSSLGKSIAGSLALLPSREAADAFCEVIRQRQKQPRWAPLIENCETISSVVPARQEQKLAILADIHRSLSDLVLEKMSSDQSRRLREIKAQLAAQRPLRTEEAPPELLDRFRERDGTVGRIAIVTARPEAKLELGPNLEAFADAVRNVPVGGQLYDAAGEKVVFADLLRNIEREGPLTTVLSLLGVCALVVVLFRSARASALVIGTLITGVILMGGVAVLLGLKINFFNFIVFPITFGIAVDYGANVVQRVRERGGQVLTSVAEVGPAVALCSWTSIIGYSTLLFSLNRALRSFGWYAMVGEVTSIICALVLLPVLRLIIPARVGVPSAAAQGQSQL